MAWFKRQSKGIQTPTEEKKDIPKGLSAAFIITTILRMEEKK